MKASPTTFLTQKLKIMRKIQELGSILNVEIPEALEEWNEENDSERARLNFAYASNTRDLSEGEDEAARLLLAQHTNGQRYSVMVNLSSIEGKDTEEKRVWFENQLKGKKVTFTTFIADISELLADTENDGETIVNNGVRDYRTLSDSFLGKNDDEKGALDRLRARLLQQINDGVLSVGSITDKKDSKQRKR